jgi:DNA mismatch repair protein MutS2
VAAVRAAIQGDEPWHPAAVPDLRQPLARLRVIGVRWSGGELLAAAQLLRSSRTTRESLRDERRPSIVRAVLAPIVDRLLVRRAEEEAIERTLLDDGSVKDDASHALRRIRRELRAAHGELVRILERAMARLESHHRVADASVTVRNGRFVIPVRRAGGAEVGGIVHDVSQSGGTLFVEPPAAIEFGNRMRELEVDEQEEVDRILLELTDSLRPHREALAASMDALAELDALFARALRQRVRVRPRRDGAGAPRVRHQRRAPPAPPRAGA